MAAWRSLIGCAALLLVAGPALGQAPPATCPDPPAAAEDATALANEWFEKGNQGIEDGEYDAAFEAFSCANALAPHPAAMINAAQAATLARRYDDALPLLERILALGAETEFGLEAKRMIEQIEEERSAAERDAPDQDGAASAAEDAEPGVSASGAAEPAAAGGSSTSEVDDHADATASAGAKADGMSGLKAGGIVCLATGFAGVLVGGVMQGLAGAAQQTTEETESFRKYEVAKQDMQMFQKGALAGFIAGGVVLGAGIVMLAVGGDDGEEEAQLALTPLPGGMALSGRF